MCLNAIVRHAMIEQMRDNENGDDDSRDSMYLFHAPKVGDLFYKTFDLNQIFSFFPLMRLRVSMVIPR